jgi:hypothetical protein
MAAMRMWHYFVAGVILLVPALGWIVVSGLLHDGSERHLWAGLFGAILGVAVHTLTILFMLITGRVLREAMRTRPLGPEFLVELNDFFARKKAYPLAALGASSLVATGVLGFSQRGFGLSPVWHMLLGLFTVVFNLWALQEELRALRHNQILIDRVASALDALDLERPEQAAAFEAQTNDPTQRFKLALAFAFGAWFPYLYWVLINWRGDFTRVSVHPWLEASALGFVLAYFAWRAKKRGGAATG